MKTALVTLSLLMSLSALAQDSLIFQRDDRAADGALTEVSIVKTEYDTSKVSLRQAHFGGFTGDPIDTTEVLIQHAECAVSTENEMISKVVCSEDNRPVDGALNVVTVESVKGLGVFNVTLHKEVWNRIEQRLVVEDRVLAQFLELK